MAFGGGYEQGTISATGSDEILGSEAAAAAAIAAKDESVAAAAAAVPAAVVATGAADTATAAAADAAASEAAIAVERGLAVALARAERLGQPIYGGINLIAMPGLPLPPYVNFTRAGKAWDFGPNGDLVEYGENEIRHAYDPATRRYMSYRYSRVSRTNHCVNNTMVGVVVGAPGSPPTGVSISADANGIAREIVGVVDRRGMKCLRLRFFGTATTSHTKVITPLSSGGASAAAGQVWAQSCFFAVVTGEINDLNAIGCRHVEVATGLGSVATGTLEPFSSHSDLRQYSSVRALANVNTTHIIQQVVFMFASGIAYDFTVDVAANQLEQSPFATTPILTEGSAVTVPGEVMNIPVPAHLWSSTALVLIFRGRVFGQFASGSRHLVGIDDGTGSNRFGPNCSSANLTVSCGVVTQSAQVFGTNFGQMAAGEEFCVAMKCAANNFAASRDGEAARDGSDGGMPIGLLPLIKVGYRQENTQPMPEYCISQIALFPVAAPNDAVQALSRLS